MKKTAGMMVMLILILPVFVHGYIDLGTGSYVFQVLMATMAGVIFGFRLVIKRIFTFLNRSVLK